jgi:glycosyltransferase involved in cell wall biosynthesis
MAKKIGVLTFAVIKAGIVPLSNLISILGPEQNEVSLITDNEGYDHFRNDPRIKTFNIRHRSHSNAIINTLNYVHKQLLISYRILTDMRSVDTWIFFFNAETMVFPLITLKLLRKKVILALPSSSEKIHAHSGERQAAIMRALSRISYRMADRIIVYSPRLIDEWGLSKYADKIRIAHEHIIDSNEFRAETSVSGRHGLIGYIGRLDAEKGIMNFVRSIPEILKHDPDIKFLIIGDGNQTEAVREYIVGNGIAQSITLAGWVPHGELPGYLNQVKLLVIPSYTEGLPNTMLEAMACGTPVLANPVGSIPDYVKDRQNGFILEDNSAERIAEQVLHILGHSDLEKIAENGKRTVESEFTYEASAKTYAEALST